MIWIIAGIVLTILMEIQIYKEYKKAKAWPGIFLLIVFFTIANFIGAFYPVDTEHRQISELSYPMYEMAEDKYLTLDNKGNLIFNLGQEEGYHVDTNLNNNKYYTSNEPHYIKRTYSSLKGIYWWLGFTFPTTEDIYYLTEPYINLLS